MPDKRATPEQLLTAESWSVEVMGQAVDDARQVDGVWYRRDIATKEFIPIRLEYFVNPLFKNPPPKQST
jgi:hypothetical protein